MSENHEFLSGILRQGSRALAGYAAEDLLKKHPEAVRGFDPDPLAGWRNWLAARVEELAAAIGAARPRLFLSQVRWGRALLQSRGIPSENLRNGLSCLRDVLATELPEQCRSTAAEYVDQALAAFDEPPADLSTRLLSDTPAGRLASTFLLALFEGDRRRATGLILDALERGDDVRELYLHVLLPAQEEIGRMWAANEINIAEEHFATQTTKMVMTRLLASAKVKLPNGKTVVAAAVAGNQHDIGLQAVTDFFEIDGWRTVLLGANVPARDLAQAVDYFDADLLGLSVSLPTQIEAAKTAIRAVRDSARGAKVKILLGGGAFRDSDDLPRELGADGYAADAVAALTLGRKLVGLE